MTTLPLIIEALTLGLIGGTVPGPILTAVFTEALNGGFKRSLIAVLKALLAESIVAILVLSFFALWDLPAQYFYALSLGGAIVLFWLAWQVWGINKIVGEKKELFGFWKLFLLTILNGAFWIFWITICVPRAFALKEALAGGHVLFLVLFELGWVISTAGLAFVFSRFRPLLMKKKLVGTVFKFFALVLIAFGVKAIWEGVGFFTNEDVGGDVEKEAYYQEFENYCDQVDGSIEVAGTYYCVTEDMTCSYGEFVDAGCE